jgi:hypothetical protein
VRKFAFAAMIVCLALYAWSVWYDRSLRREDPFGYRNLKACTKIAAGSTEADLLRTLGAPERREGSGGVRRLLFHTHRVAAAPIMAEVDPATGRVLALHCPGDDKPRWNVRP